MHALFLLKRFNRAVTVFQHKKEIGVVIFSVSLFCVAIKILEIRLKAYFNRFRFQNVRVCGITGLDHIHAVKYDARNNTFCYYDETSRSSTGF